MNQSLTLIRSFALRIALVSMLIVTGFTGCNSEPESAQTERPESEPTLHAYVDMPEVVAGDPVSVGGGGDFDSARPKQLVDTSEWGDSSSLTFAPSPQGRRRSSLNDNNSFQPASGTNPNQATPTLNSGGDFAGPAVAQPRPERWASQSFDPSPQK